MNKIKIESFDILRGFLALCVLLTHIPNLSESVGLPSYNDLPIFKRGEEAVYVFFTLSGFLIIGLLYDEKKRKGFVSIRKFYMRRILRLYPVYYLILALGLVLYHLIIPSLGIPFEYNYNIWEGLALNVFFLPNIFRTLYDPGIILLVLWSIGIEEQFYLVIAPLFRIVLLKNTIKYLLAFTIVYFVLYHLNTFSFLKDFFFLYYFISAGGVMALLIKIGYKIYFTRLGARFILYFVFLLHFSTDIFQFENEIIKNIFEVLLFSLLIVNLSTDTKISPKLKFLRYLGEISYGMYMYHMCIVTFVVFLFLKINPILNLEPTIVVCLIYIISITGTITVSHLSYKYYEAYFLQKKKNFR